MNEPKQEIVVSIEDTRPSVTHEFKINGIKGFVNVGLDPFGVPMELFLTISKEGSTLGGFADAFSRVCSLALQHGFPLDELCQKMKGLSFEPRGLTTNTKLPFAQSIIDYVFTWIEQNFVSPNNAS